MTSLHHKIFADIERKIVEGTWPPGERIPFEHQLEAQYACSRMTVNKAMTALAERNMIVRRRRAGSFVARPQIERLATSATDIGDDAARIGRHSSYEILSRAIDGLRIAEASKIGVSPGSEVLRVECLHKVDGQPNAVEKCIILLKAAPQARNEMFLALPPALWLLSQNFAFIEGRNVIRGVAADAVTARMLGMERGAPCLMLCGQTWANGLTVTYSEIIHPGDRYHFSFGVPPEGVT